MSGTEDLTLNFDSATPWTVTVDGTPQAITLVAQSGTGLFLETGPGGAGEVLLSYSGGGYVTGDTTGLALQPVADFPVPLV